MQVMVEDIRRKRNPEKSRQKALPKCYIKNMKKIFDAIDKLDKMQNRASSCLYRMMYFLVFVLIFLCYIISNK